jgi:hypothetical protein
MAHVDIGLGGTLAAMLDVSLPLGLWRQPPPQLTPCHPAPRTVAAGPRKADAMSACLLGLWRQVPASQVVATRAMCRQAGPAAIQSGLFWQNF